MNRLAVSLRLPADVQQVSSMLLDSEGLCTCGRALKRLDAKFILAAVVPTKLSMVIAAYCQPCFVEINAALKHCHKINYDGSVYTEPVDRKIKKL